MNTFFSRENEESRRAARPRPLALIFAAAAFCLLASGCALQQWKESGASEKIQGRAYTSAFLDDARGIAVGYSGLALYTADGGKTWENGANESMCLFACQMLDANFCFAAGNGNNVIASSDGGKSWSHMANIAGRGKSISFTDPAHGFAASKTWLGVTQDAGKSWATVTLPSGANLVETVFSNGPGTAYVIANGGTLYRTADSGSTWVELSAPFPAKDPGFKPSYARDNQCVTVRMEGDTGFAAAVGTARGKPVLAIRMTKDGGKSWSAPERHPLAAPAMTVTAGTSGLLNVFGGDSVVTRFVRG